MNAPEFSIQYPMFVLQRGDGGYAAFHPDEKARDILAVPIFTTEARARDFRVARGAEAEVKVFDRDFVFRRFVQSMRDRPYLFAFDPICLATGEIHAGKLYLPAVIEERFLPNAMTWGYPVYALLGWGGRYYCLDGEGRSLDGSRPDGRIRSVVVLTDKDLADREIMTKVSAGLVAVPIETAGEFAQFLRRMPQTIEGVLFDPPSHDGVKKTRMFQYRDRLIVDLEARV